MESFRKRLADALAPHGAVTAFAKKTHFARGTVDRWLDGTSPSLDHLEQIARELGMEPWELIRPEPDGLSPSQRRLIAFVRANPDRLDSLLDVVDGIERRRKAQDGTGALGT